MNKKNNQIYDADAKYFIELFSNLWKRKIFIIRTTLIFTFIGVIYSLSLKNNFTASSVFYPHYQNNEMMKGQGLRSLAGIAGINLGGNDTEDVPVTLYPNIISSPTFKIEILDSKINLEEKELSYREYLLSKPTQFNLKKILFLPITLTRSILSKFNSKVNSELSIENNEILKISNEEYSLHKALSEIISLELNPQEGFINLSVKDHNPLVASQIANTANDILQKNIIDFKLKNLNDTYNFISNQLDIAKNNFYKLQDSLAIFSDKNRNIKSDLFLNKYSRIESEYNISKNIYNELALNKEKTAIDVKKNTPIFTIIKPVVIPNEKSDPKRSSIVIIFSFIGLISASGYTLFKPILLEFWKEIIKNTNK